MVYYFDLIYRWQHKLNKSTMTTPIYTAYLWGNMNSTPVYSGVHVAHLFCFLWYVFLFCLTSSCVLCTKFLWIEDSWFPLWFSLMFMQSDYNILVSTFAWSDLKTIVEHLISSLIFSKICFAQFFVFVVVFCGPLSVQITTVMHWSLYGFFKSQKFVFEKIVDLYQTQDN